ncbi:MAG TPA: hypothetical protein VGK17_23210, partial [Propionicimonas sp.]
MARLGAEAEALVARPSLFLTAAEAHAYLESLPELWVKTSDAGRHAIAEAVFERIDVLGANDFTFTLTAHGWDAAFGVGDQSISIGQSGRGERICTGRSHAADRAARGDLDTPTRGRVRSQSGVSWAVRRDGRP